MAVIDLRQETGDGGKRERMLANELKKAQDEGRSLGFRFTLFLRDRERDTYGTVPNTAFMVNCDPKEENVIACLTAMDRLQDLIALAGVEQAAAAMTQLVEDVKAAGGPQEGA